MTDEKYNVLVLGSGGREHAIIKQISRSNLLKNLYTNSTNPFWHEHAQYLMIGDCNGSFVELAYKCKQANIEIVVVGQEQYLADGISEVLAEENIKTFGPSRNAARLESLKSFTKELCSLHNIPTPLYWHFVDKSNAIKFVEGYTTFPLVVKADGLAGGKGVSICPDQDTAIHAINSVFSCQVDRQCRSVIIEEFLEGDELSFFAFIDGHDIVPFGSAHDYKQIVLNNSLVNTGGMGGFSTPSLSDAGLSMERTIMRDIIYPTINALYSMGIKYKGVLFAGIIIHKGQPKLLEYNVRFGDPETQCMLPRLESDLLKIIVNTIDGNLSFDQVKLNNKSCVCVVMASTGYPQDYQKFTQIKNLDEVSKIPNIEIFHAGTTEQDGKVMSVGGRVLNIVAVSDSLATARANAYKAVEMVDWPEGFYIQNIGELDAQDAC